MANSWNGKPYYSFDAMLKERFSTKVYKVALNGGMSCPNRDGTLGNGGCIFCSAGGSGDFAGNSCDSITTQIKIQADRLREKRGAKKFIAYFQAYTNTYAPVDYLEKIFTEAEYLELLKDYDLITTKRVVLNNSYHYGFATNHNIHALDMTGEVIKELYPEYYDTFVQLVNGTETYFGNMIVTSKKWFDTYCEWLFHIFFEVQKRICLENGEDDYHKRVFGFISEFLLLVWVRVNHLKVYECKVGMLGEKAETREMKEQLASYFISMDVFGAKTYFAEMLKKRPDVLMEASDITGELKLSMQIIATMNQELQRTGHCYLRKENRFRELITLFTRLNAVIRAYMSGQVTEEDRRFLIEQSVSETAVKVGVFILPISAEQKKKLETEILKDLNA